MERQELKNYMKKNYIKYDDFLNKTKVVDAEIII